MKLDDTAALADLTPPFVVEADRRVVILAADTASVCGVVMPGERALFTRPVLEARVYKPFSQLYPVMPGGGMRTRRVRTIDAETAFSSLCRAQTVLQIATSRARLAERYRQYLRWCVRQPALCADDGQRYMLDKTHVIFSALTGCARESYQRLRVDLLAAHPKVTPTRGAAYFIEARSFEAIDAIADEALGIGQTRHVENST